MNDIQIFKNKEFGEVRAIEINGEPWLVGKDVADILGYNPHGVELPGTLGENCEYALEQFQRGNRLTVDRIAGRNTFLRLIA